MYMSITIPKPGALKPFLTKPKIPGLVAIGLLAAQYLFFGPGTSPEPSCTLNVEQIHKSTNLIEERKILAIKLNVTSECNVPQESTTIDAHIDQILGNQQITVREFKNEIARPTKQENSKARFLWLFEECVKSEPILYSGYAKGHVMLKDGRKIEVSGISPKFQAISCRVKAK